MKFNSKLDKSMQQIVSIARLESEYYSPSNHQISLRNLPEIATQKNAGLMGIVEMPVT
jgi:hypothetical protein